MKVRIITTSSNLLRIPTVSNIIYINSLVLELNPSSNLQHYEFKLHDLIFVMQTLTPSPTPPTHEREEEEEEEEGERNQPQQACTMMFIIGRCICCIIQELKTHLSMQ
jgi:hypothetical protein